MSGWIPRCLVPVTLTAAVAMGAGSGAGAAEQAEEQPQDLLEFLGTFDQQDDDWVAVTIDEMSQEHEDGGESEEQTEEASDDEN